jgi:hypothetical protein
MNPPGWFPTDGQPDERRWWNGTAWEHGVEHDQRIALERATVFGSRLHFTPDPTWPPAPTNWFPPQMWQPGPGWADPVESLWGVAAEDDDADSTLARVEELAQVVEILIRESEPDAWQITDLDRIPVVWRPPPSWPPVPHGWSPPPGWKAPRAWPRTPAGWDFWQHDPGILAYRNDALRADIEQRSTTLAGSLTGIAMMLDTGDRLLCRATQLTPLALSPLPTAVQAGLSAAPPQHIVFNTQMAHYQLNVAVSNLRTYLLRVAYGIAEADTWSGYLRRALFDAKENYTRTISDAAQAVFDVTVAAVEVEANRIGRSRRHDRQEQAVSLSAVLKSLHADMARRVRALNDVGTPGNGRATTANSGTAEWEVAEELAARHLQEAGFLDARRTPVGADGGFDVEGRGVVAQVKYRSHPAGRPDIQRLVGANQHGARAVFYSRAGYARSAIDFANQVGVALFVLDANSGVVDPANSLGESLRS